MKKKYSKS